MFSKKVRLFSCIKATLVAFLTSNLLNYLHVVFFYTARYFVPYLPIESLTHNLVCTDYIKTCCLYLNFIAFSFVDCKYECEYKIFTELLTFTLANTANGIVCILMQYMDLYCLLTRVFNFIIIKALQHKC